jgi:hypothetical protein
LLPIMWSTGTGSEITRRIAVPMIGGMISSTLLTLIVVPRDLWIGERSKPWVVAADEAGLGCGALGETGRLGQRTSQTIRDARLAPVRVPT